MNPETGRRRAATAHLSGGILFAFLAAYISQSGGEWRWLGVFAECGLVLLYGFRAGRASKP